jgi:virginiamycin B lyase
MARFLNQLECTLTRRAALFVALAAISVSCSRKSADTGVPLAGRITSDGKPVAGVPVRAHRKDSNITVSVYSNQQGEYSFPEWSEVKPADYSVAIQLADFQPAQRDGIAIKSGQTQQVDFTLEPRQPTLADATATDIIMALPGTDEQKFLLMQCDNCHALQWLLLRPRSHDEWVTLITRMLGKRASSRNTPGTRANTQMQYIEPLAEYLTQIRGLGSSGDIPFKIQPRPDSDASTRLVVTEYDVPRGGQHERYLLRGDPNFVWPHDIILNAEYGYYTDHFSHTMGRLNKKTGEVKEFPFAVPPGTGRGPFRPVAGELGFPGRPGAGPHELLFDSQSRPIIGVAGATIRFDPQTETFTSWKPGEGMFGLDPQDHVWAVEDEGALHRLDTHTGKVDEFTIPAMDGIYDIEADSKGRAIIDVWGNGFFRVFDPTTKKHVDYPTPTPGSGPRRGDMDSQDRHWVALYWAGALAMFDPNTGSVKEYPVIPGARPFGPPFASPYSAAIDEKNQIAWTTDFNSSRIYSLDVKTEQMTAYQMPLPYEARDVTVDKYAARPTLWLPAYRPPAKMVKLEMR